MHALLWSIFAFLFCASATGGCYFMKIDGFLTSSGTFAVVSANKLLDYTHRIHLTVSDFVIFHLLLANTP